MKVLVRDTRAGADRWSVLAGTFVLCLLLAASLSPAAGSTGSEGKIHKSHAIAMHGTPKYGPDFAHFEYVNPDAPKGGSVRRGAIGTFDSLHPFILKGAPAIGMGLTVDTLATSSGDEPFTYYGLLAETIEWPEDRSWVKFTLREEARWHDGRPVTADDVIFSFNALVAKGAPLYRFYYASVDKVEKLDERTVQFVFEPGENREMPLIMGQLPVLPKHYWDGRDFEKTTLEPPLGSGPYKVKDLEPGRFITYELVEDYWGKDLPVNKGSNNFATMRFDYYRDQTVAVEAFKSGDFDLRLENSAKTWATGYDIAAVRDGRIIKEEIDNQIGTGMQAFVFNTRRELFRDRRVRQALGYAFDFEWSRKNLFYGQYARTTSFFSNSELASFGLPEGEELEILERYRDRLPAEVFTREYQPPTYDGSGNVRKGLRQALRLLKDAGWTVKNGVLTNADGREFDFEILIRSPTFERIVQPFARNLEKLGVKPSVRLVDPTQFRNRTDQFDFDMIISGWAQSQSPGNEQRDFWGSTAADAPGSRNLVGIKDPLVDELIDLIIAAPSRESLVARSRALDRVLLWGHYVIPQYHSRAFRTLSWNIFGRPEKNPLYAHPFSNWWIDAAKAEAMRGKRGDTTTN